MSRMHPIIPLFIVSALVAILALVLIGSFLR
jgi:hypothetical protein